MYYSLNIRDALTQLETGEQGLSDNKAAQRLIRYGKNKLVSKHKANYLLKFLLQFKETLVIILIIATIISFALGETVDAVVILCIIIINSVIGFVQEFKAEKSVEALKKMMTPHAKVLRSGVAMDVMAEDLVPGDIILLEEGDKIPADARVIESISMQTSEASLTGESTPVIKSIEKLAAKKLVPAFQKNMVFMGTLVTKGRGRAVITSTGMDTEFGKIANLTQEMKADPSPLKKEMALAGKFIAKATLGISATVFIVGIIIGGFGIENLLDEFLFAISIAVAAIPEGLPATLTIALALGVQRMAKRKAIVRKLQSVETLGSTRIICSDKTGTLTKNEMTVRKLWMPNKYIEISGSGYVKEGKFSGKYDKKHTKLLLNAGLLANDASEGKQGYLGDPTEIALLVSAAKYGLKISGKRVVENPFDSDRKLMSVLVKDKKSLAYVKGAPVELLKHCTHYLHNGKKKKLTTAMKKEIMSSVNSMADEALRVLGFAYKETSSKKNLELGLTFIGLQGMIDPPRDEVKLAVKQCKDAGIKIFVITGDAGNTAGAIARELGIAKKDTPIITGAELDNIKPPELLKILEKDSAIFARVTPEHKLRIVSTLKEAGEIVSVTGDGVNDAPALKRADIGVAMGITGTDVSKEASDIILADDSFATIVSAIGEGRNIYGNIKKFLRYMFSSNLGELWTILFGLVALGGAHIITPIQILWINIATDMFPALSLGVDPPDTDVMHQKPRDPSKRIITRRNFLDWAAMGFVMGLGTFLAYLYYDKTEPLKAVTVAFTLLVVYQLVNVVNCRSETESVFKLGLFNNPWIWMAILLGIGLQMTIMYVPFFADLFHIVALNGRDLIIIGFTSLTILLYDELRKIVIRHRRQNKLVTTV